MRTLHVLSFYKVSVTEAGKATIVTIVGVQAVLAPIYGAGTTGGCLLFC